MSEDEIAIVAEIDDKFNRGLELTDEELQAYLDAYAVPE
jgi:hypothetical protein